MVGKLKVWQLLKIFFHSQTVKIWQIFQDLTNIEAKGEKFCLFGPLCTCIQTDKHYQTHYYATMQVL